MNDKARAIFVVGSSRSGTTLTHQLLASHSRLAGLNETSILKKLNAPNYDVSKAIKRFSRSEMESEIVQAHFDRALEGLGPQDIGPYQFFDAFCEAHRLHFGADAYVEKTPINAMVVDGLLSQIHGSKVVIVTRDPRAIVASRMRHRRTGRGKNLRLPRKVQFYLNLSSTMFTYRFLDQWFSHWELDGTRVIFVKYEDIITQPKEALSPVWEFFSLPPEDVHLRIQPRDLRMQASKRAGLMNSSFGDTPMQTVSRTSLENWHETLSDSEADFAAACLANLGLKYIKALYPEIATPRGSPRISLMKAFSRADHHFFVHKNIRGLKTVRVDSKSMATQPAN